MKRIPKFNHIYI